MSGRGLVDVAVADLVALRSCVQDGSLRAPLGSAALGARGLGHLAVAMAPYAGLDAPGLGALLDGVLAERTHNRAPAISLVWTGEDPDGGFSRHTRILLPELLANAREVVLIAGYSFDRPEEMFRPLHAVMVERGVKATLVVDVGQLELRVRDAARRQKLSWKDLSRPLRHTSAPIDRGRAVVALFTQVMWPFGDPRPTVYFDPRTAAARPLASMHAKCVVIDRRVSLVTSANFTERGHNRNIEAGVVIDDPAFARALSLQWSNLIEAGVIVS